MTPIFLIGMPGCGKSTLGRALGRSTHLQFIDLDTYIERRFHAGVSDIFARPDGERQFREIERRMLHEVSDFVDVVVACGGGTPCFYDNIDHMLASGTVVWLDAGRERTLARLIAGRRKRPAIAAFADGEIADYLDTTVAARTPFYSRAHYRFNSDHLDDTDGIARSVDEFTRQILSECE